MLLDTHAWISVFQDNEQGKKALELAEGKILKTSLATISELASWALKNDLNPHHVIDGVKARSQLLPFTEEVARVAGALHAKYKAETPRWGMVDSMIYATALVSGLEILTGAPHFEGKPNVRYLGRPKA